MGEREGAAAALCLLAGPGRGRALPWHRVDGGGASNEHVRSAARGRSTTRDHAHMAPGHAPPPWNQAQRRRQPRPTAGLVATLPRASQTLPTSLLCVPGPRLRRSATGRAALLQQFAPGLCSQRPAPPGPRLPSLAGAPRPWSPHPPPCLLRTFTCASALTCMYVHAHSRSLQVLRPS